jgi:two-component system NtrC family sensor kinase
MSSEKILVVDDRQENLLFLAESVLRPEGYQVITAMDGKQALDIALTEKPDLIITDLKMPHMSGLEMMAALRKAGTNIPVILTTFYGSEQTAIQAFRLGAKDYIIKPYDIGEMLESVERALIEQRLRRETKDLKEGVETSRHLEERVRQLNSLCGIGKALNAIRDPDEVMRVSVEAAIYLSDADAGQLFLMNPETGQLELCVVRGPSDSRARRVRQVGADPATAQVAQTGRAVITERSDGRRGTISRLVVPLRASDKVIGVLAVDAKPAHIFNDNDRYQLDILANFVAVALSNAQLIEELQEGGAAQPERAVEGATTLSETPPAAAWADGMTEVQNLASELRKLADATEALAARFQEQRDAG